MQARSGRVGRRELSRHFPLRHAPVVSNRTPARNSITYISAMLALTAVFAFGASAVASSTDPWTGLDSGRVGEYYWEVKAKRQPGAGSGRVAAHRPCLLVGTTWELGPFNYRRSRFRACAGAKGHLTAADPPLLATGVQPSSGDRVKMTAVGMIFAPAVRRVRVTLADGREQTIHLDRFSAKQARTSRLSRFKYAAFAIRGLWCAERLVSQSAAGKTLWDSGTDELGCSGNGSKGSAGSPEFAPQ